jgi:hypothetical protein
MRWEWLALKFAILIAAGPPHSDRPDGDEGAPRSSPAGASSGERRAVHHPPCAAVAFAVFAAMIVSIVTFAGRCDCADFVAESVRNPLGVDSVAIVLATAIPAMRTIVTKTG